MSDGSCLRTDFSAIPKSLNPTPALLPSSGDRSAPGAAEGADRQELGWLRLDHPCHQRQGGNPSRGGRDPAPGLLLVTGVLYLYHDFLGSTACRHCAAICHRLTVGLWASVRKEETTSSSAKIGQDSKHSFAETPCAPKTRAAFTPSTAALRQKAKRAPQAKLAKMSSTVSEGSAGLRLARSSRAFDW